jgi:peptide/nickel transport system permease protein
MRLKNQEFVMATRAAGARDLRIILRTILPNAMPPLVISVTLLVGICILFEAALSFLGLSDPEVMTWGLMIGGSRDYFWEAWWTVTFPGLAILITVLCIALIGDGLNDALNPKLRKRR